MSCENVQTTEKHRVRCPTCNREYTIQKLTHVCNPILPCDLKGNVRYVERYIDVEEPHGPSRVPRVECNLCEELTVKQNTPQKNKCPACGYVGFYVADEGKLCPVCRIVPPEKPKKTPKAPKTSDVGAALVVPQLPSIQLLPTVVATGADPSKGQCVSIHIDGWHVVNVLSGIWCPGHWEFEFSQIAGQADGATWSRLEESYREGMQSLSEWLVQLRQSYSIKWSFGSDIGAKLWLWYLWTLYGDNRTELGYSP